MPANVMDRDQRQAQHLLSQRIISQERLRVLASHPQRQSYPDLCEAYLGRGNVKLELKKTIEALADFDRALLLAQKTRSSYTAG
jgi:hypothetical protein